MKDPSVSLPGHRRSIRLAEYDYTQAGAYFITLVTMGRACVFGDVKDGDMVLNAAGLLAEREWENLPGRFSGVELDAFQMMPNHIHGILILTNTTAITREGVGAQRDENTPLPSCPTLRPSGGSTPVAGKVPSGSVAAIVRSYKASVALRYNRMHLAAGGSLWQRNYYEHIIRNTERLDRIREYIVQNPRQWAHDQENPHR